MKIVYNRYIPFKDFIAINLFGVLFVRLNEDGTKPEITDRIIRHEMIHTAQMKELFYVFFYIMYFLEWLINLIFYKEYAYENISFEKEAYDNEDDENYLERRTEYKFLDYM